MKILFLSTVYPHPSAPVRGTFNRELCRSLSSLADVRVISPLPWTDRVKHPISRLTTYDGVNVSYPTFFYTPKILRTSYGSFMSKSIRGLVERTLKEFKPDWVLSYWAHPDGEAGLRIAKQCGAQAGVIVGGSDILLLTEEPGRRDRIMNVLQNSDAVFSVSHALNRRAMVLGAMPAKIHTIYQGVNDAVLKPGFKSLARQALNLSTSERIFLWVGRMVGLKRLDRLIESFGSVHESEPTARLVLVGDGPLMGSVRKQIETRGLTNSVLLPGTVPAEDLVDWYRAADATVLSSESEGLPNVLRESLACGTPFVSTAVGSVNEIANDAYSIVVPVGDIQAMTRAMTRILNPEYKRSAELYRARTWHDCARDFMAVLSGRPNELLTDVAADLGPAELMAIAGNEAGMETVGSTSVSGDEGGGASTILADDYQVDPSKNFLGTTFVETIG